MNCRSILLCLVSAAQPIAAADYVIRIEGEAPRVAQVEARLSTLPGGELHLRRAARDTGLYHGWATFLHQIEAQGESGEAIPVRFAPDDRFVLENTASGTPVTVKYTMLLQHDRFPNLPGSDELAWARDDAVMWTTRALLLEGMPAEDIEVRFELPADWRATTPWQEIEPGIRFRAADTDALLDAAFVAGTHHEARLGDGPDAPVRIALAGPYAKSASEPIMANLDTYLREFEALLGTPPRDRLLLIAGDADYWGGGVMGSTISMLVGGALDEHTLPMVRFVTTHELFHLWNAHFPYTDQPARERLYWFMEGTATYYAWRAQVSQGDLTDAEFQALLEQEIATYHAARGELSLAEAGADKLQNYDLVYSGGLVAVMLLDEHIRSESSGERSLDDVMRALAGGSTGSKAVVLDGRNLAEVIRRVTGVDVSELLASGIHTPGELPIERVLAAGGGTQYLDPGQNG